MRQVIWGFFAALLLANPALVGPAQAQSAAPSTAPSSASKPAANAKSQDGKSGPAPASQPNPAPQTAKDDSMANYDVNGSNASDAMGTPP